jgi:peptidoglycan/xylan/chitin deacetylase (PgdA/CDA1 family)
MVDRLTTVLDLVEPYGCAATLPVPAAVVARHPRVIARYAVQGIEFAVHGLFHVDHARLTPAAQIDQLRRARLVFERHEIDVAGFRAPYLRWNDATIDALRECGYDYDASQAMHFPPAGNETESYRRSLAFCASLDAEHHPVVPWTERGVVRIPYVLPDDETALDRLELDPDTVAKTWLSAFAATYDRGELFTLSVHPERVALCASVVTEVLRDAARRRPGVWIARLRDIASWWTARAAARAHVSAAGSGRWSVAVDGPPGTTLLARGDAGAGEPWGDGWRKVDGPQVVLAATRRPCIGVHPAAEGTARFLREQGYVVETTGASHDHELFVADEHPLPARGDLLAAIEGRDFPLVRLGRWPGGMRSALSFTGDVDALSLRDYACRLFGR